MRGRKKSSVSETSWTYLLFVMEIIGVFGMWHVGEKRWWGWLIVLLHSFPWAVYSVVFDKPGFILMTLLWWTMHFRNMVKWRSQSRTEVL